MNRLSILVMSWTMVAFNTTALLGESRPPASRLPAANEAPHPKMIPAEPRRRFPAEIPRDADLRWLHEVATDSSSDIWLGVRLTGVPEPLASHLGTDRNALMVENVYKDSPADRAGIDRYDVITGVEGKQISGGLGAFRQHIHRRKPGEVLTLNLYHKGKATTREVQLDREPAEWNELEMKYPDHPWDPSGRRFGIRGKILRPGPNGWELQDLGEIPALKDLYRFLAPEYSRRATGNRIDKGRRVDSEGKVLEVLRRADGTIMVKRYDPEDEHAEPSVIVYADLEELRTADHEAYELLASGEPASPEVSDSHVEKGEGDSIWDRWKDPEFRDWFERFFQGPMRHLEHSDLLRRFRGPDHEATEADALLPEFEIGVDGEISIHIAGPEGRLSRTFESEDAFRDQAPELYAAFDRLRQRIR